MWLIFLAGLLVAGVIHARLMHKTTAQTLELVLVYLLAGYCGVGQIAMAAGALVMPDHIAEHMGMPPGNPIMVWTAFLLLGMGVIGTMTIWLRGNFLVGPIVAWTIFWAGATYAHINAEAVAGHPVTPTDFAWNFAAHGFIAVLLIGLSLAYWRASRGRA